MLRPLSFTTRACIRFRLGLIGTLGFRRKGVKGLLSIVQIAAVRPAIVADQGLSGRNERTGDQYQVVTELAPTQGGYRRAG